jgi:hypothetical protein
MKTTAIRTDPKHRSWNVTADGRTFTISADRAYRRRERGPRGALTYHVVYVWEIFADGTSVSIATPFDAYRAPLASAQRVIAARLAPADNSIRSESLATVAHHATHQSI